ncbi:tRNA pseudouridine(55) synthase TruB [Bdellovibrio sp. SKB1291214]|uniref:tRNA pseudouridine(55) synthase TruB n=1 Tax=Bdellovibrio sp. SKB1291214 TaxID=1732569 RepID=UPI000B514BA8|nr:tRNA pseudouridine(55) synthase TruB [Bdellovibrio sp. SKB1291214]UYL08481.1 tRNA pseudouridine(55) synthase TruB [Bdellovibrio sp. SKB1291214]
MTNNSENFKTAPAKPEGGRGPSVKRDPVDFHGLLLVDKPSGISSHDVVARLRRIMGTKSVGHSGTLDPMASGLMACLINEGTKLSQYILEGDKGYRVRIQFGIRTDTLDTTGETLETKPVNLVEATLLAEAMKLQGEMEVEVPIYSAIKVQGKKLYEYARSEKDVVIPKKIMNFWDVKFLGMGQDWAEFDLRCSKGSYIRTWVDLLGQALGCGAAMSGLRRTYSAPYILEQGQTLEVIEECVKKNTLTGCFVTMDAALPMVKRIRVKGQDQVLLGNGQISHDLRSQLIAAFNPDSDQFVQVLSMEGKLLAIVGLESGRGFVLKRVFKY